MSVGSICSRVVATVAKTDSVIVAARRMEEHDVGTVVVLEPDGPSRALGILTDRDIVLRCVAHALNPETTPVGEVMTTPAQTADEDTPIEEALARMVSAGVRRLIITAKGQGVVGILSLDDVLDLLALDARAVSRLLEQQRPQIRA
ncbi:MAG TPA: CBS domain-containing protein [Gemmatimonadales bacterium]